GRVNAAAGAHREALAVAWLPVDEQIAAEAAGVGEARDLIAALRAEHMVRGRELDGRHVVECYHDRIREAVVRALHPDELRRLHQALAEAMEKRAAVDPEVVSQHFREAGDFSRAATLVVAAAERAGEALAFEREAELHKQAL